MFTCPKCGQKLKTLHERVYGEKPHYVPSGYHCKTCRIFYDASTKQTSKAVYGVADAKKELGGVRLVAAFEDQERIRKSLHKTHANAASTACGDSAAVFSHVESSAIERRENKWMGRDSNSRPPVCETGILTRLDYPSTAHAVC